jgi:hypothetical protein
VANPAQWENATLERFLDAMQDWIADMMAITKTLDNLR